VTPELLVALLVMAAVSYACRVSGFVMMRFVPLNAPRVRAWINGIPVSIMGALLAPALLKGGPAEWLGFVVAGGVFKATGNDIAAVVAAVVAVAITRALL
jgi:uncharacterized membrane protein